MVSWLLLLNARWNTYENRLRPNGDSAAIQAHHGFNSLKASSPNGMEAGFKAWLEDSMHCPGVVMMVREESNPNKGMVEAIHHIKQLNDKGEGAIVVEVEGLGQEDRHR